MQQLGTRACSPAAETRKLCLCHLVGVLTCKPVTLVVSYLPAGLVGCSVDPRINYDARKLARTPQVKKKKKKICNNWTREGERRPHLCLYDEVKSPPSLISPSDSSTFPFFLLKVSSIDIPNKQTHLRLPSLYQLLSSS